MINFSVVKYLSESEDGDKLSYRDLVFNKCSVGLFISNSGRELREKIKIGDIYRLSYVRGKLSESGGFLLEDSSTLMVRYKGPDSSFSSDKAVFQVIKYKNSEDGIHRDFGKEIKLEKREYGSLWYLLPTEDPISIS